MKYIFLTIIFVCLLSPGFVLAQGVTQDTGSAAMRQLNVGAGFEEGDEIYVSDPRGIAVNIIKILLSILGALFTLLVVYGGYLYLTSQGEESKVTKAQSTIKSAIIGLIIIMLAYSITVYVGRALVGAIGGTGSSREASTDKIPK
jgi:hypothetical protein